MKALAVFETVARNGGFRAAAAKLGVDHLTAARQVRLLESGLGVALLNTLIAKDDLDSGRLVKARPEGTCNETYVVRAINTARHKEARVVTGWIRRQVRAELTRAEPMTMRG